MNRPVGILAAALLITANAQAGDKLSQIDKVKAEKVVGITVVLNAPLDSSMLASLEAFGDVINYFDEIDGVVLRGLESDLPAIAALPFVAAAGLDSERQGGPFDSTGIPPIMDSGYSTWNLDAINVTDVGRNNRQVDYDGAGVYVAVIDTGLIHTWRSYFPEDRVATEYAIAFEGGGGDHGFVTDVPNLWERDVNSHGTHVTSTILGYVLWQSYGGVVFNGVAPGVRVIPVKVLNQNGSGWSSMVAMGILHVANLKAGPLAASPVVINMSLGGGRLDPIEKAAIDYAIAQGVIIVASAGNNGTRGMGYPGAYAPVISVAATGWAGQWYNNYWWYNLDVADPINPADYFIANFSSRARTGQDLDVAAPGVNVVGPYQVNQGQLGYYYLGGTSMASPHVAGVVALMAQKNNFLTPAAAEIILQDTAVPLPAGCITPLRSVAQCWGATATGAGLMDAQAALNMVP